MEAECTGCIPERRGEDISHGVKYSEKKVGTFFAAVRYIVTEYNLEDPEECFCLVDIDGTLVEGQEAPFSHLLSDMEIEESTLFALRHLIEELGDRVSIFTNRNPRERVFWDSKGVLEKIRKAFPGVEVFDSLSKQVPGFERKRIEEMVKYIAQFRSKKLLVIEDDSLLFFSRKGFLTHVAEQLKRVYGIEVEVINYVISS